MHFIFQFKREDNMENLIDKLVYIIGSVTVALLMVVSINVTPVYAASCTASCSGSGEITCEDSHCSCDDGDSGGTASCNCTDGDNATMFCKA